MLADCTELVKMLKQTALDAVDAKKPAAVYYGTVLSAAPLKIDVEQKMTLSQAQLVLTRAVVDHYVDIEVKHEGAKENHDLQRPEARGTGDYHPLSGRAEIPGG